jgi:hypothetical protein
MKGIWSLTTNLLGSSFRDGYAVARITINIIFLCVLSYVLARPPRGYKTKSSYDAIRYGTVILTAYVALILSWTCADTVTSQLVWLDGD